MAELLDWLRKVFNRCPECGQRFNEWFFWPGVGTYCWPCLDHRRRLVTRERGLVAVDIGIADSVVGGGDAN